MKNILLLALSTFRINGDEINESELKYKEKSIGKYHYQLEPILHLYKYRKDEPDIIIYLYTEKTDEKFEFKIDSNKYNLSAREYFEKKACELFPNVKFIPIEVTSDVVTIKKVIKELRDQYSEKPNETQLTMDIHGAFRDTQMMLQSIITLLRFEDIIPKEIYTVQYSDSIGIIEKVDEINDVNEYVSAMNEFLTFGRSKTLESYIKKTNQGNELSELIKAISDSIQLCNVNLFDDAIKRMSNYINNYPDNGVGNYNDIFIESIKASYGELMDEEKRSLVAIKVKWCLEHDFIQQALTLIESEMLQDLCNRNVIKYHYDHPEKKEMNLYDKDNHSYKRILLSDALDKSKQHWESKINYSLIRWIREIFCNKSVNNENYYTISGGDKNKYIDWDIGQKQIAFSTKTKIFVKGENYGDYISLSFDVNEKLTLNGKKNLARLLMLHLALKECRNESNHASSKKRASVDEVKQAICAYVELANMVINECKS